MTRFFFLVCGLASIAASVAAAADVTTPSRLAAVATVDRNAAGAPAVAAELTAAQIVEKNVAARGGLEAWRKIQTMAWVGHIETAHGPAPTLQFRLEMKRPNKTHFEINALHQRTVRVYDGTRGWKVRPSADGQADLQAYTLEELKFAHDAQVIDGLLIDYQAKGVAVGLDGVDEVEGRKAYRLSLMLPSGAIDHTWVDAETFLDIKSERRFRNAMGLTGRVTVYYRNFQTIEGLQIPLTVETATGADKPADKMVIEKLALNPPLEDRVFAKPRVPPRHSGASVVLPPPQPDRRMFQPVPRAAPAPSIPNQAAPGSEAAR
jgi:hypothetical protein